MECSALLDFDRPPFLWAFDESICQDVNQSLIAFLRSDEGLLSRVPPFIVDLTGGFKPMKKSIVLSFVLAASMGLAACGQKAEEAANAADATATEAVEGAENAADAAMDAAGNATDAANTATDAAGNAVDAAANAAGTAAAGAVNAAADAAKNAM